MAQFGLGFLKNLDYYCTEEQIFTYLGPIKNKIQAYNLPSQSIRNLKEERLVFGQKQKFAMEKYQADTNHVY
ncbi:hypothetical protein GWI33_018382 [Rhynchophorus ferrugineus]|uniref:Uncharacterized protein n=1 Tax=Rhynchophorus ferrugineus TaxID=354439 RepID=A0A834HW75_RHYFE|nr:hypothetical protein GWI33_018382 [Rhynchophorus ferrugineus]